MRIHPRIGYYRSGSKDALSAAHIALSAVHGVMLLDMSSITRSSPEGVRSMLRSSPVPKHSLFVLDLAITTLALPPFATAAWFSDPVVTPVERRQLGLRAADLDRDGRHEVISNTTANEYNVYRADPTGTFTVIQAIPGAMWGNFVLIDDDRDGWPDLIAQDAGGGLRLWRNDGTGRLIDCQ